MLQDEFLELQKNTDVSTYDRSGTFAGRWG
jgi:hypothetical protein